MSKTHLAFTGLTRSFGRLRVLRDLKGQIDQGQVLMVTGTNGSGKSTLLRCLAGLMAPQRGEIRFEVDGRMLDKSERRKAVGYVAPDLELYPELTVSENLRLFSRLRRVSPERGEVLRERVGLPGDRVAALLSSGMRQRLRWCWALLHRPAILLLDEPLQNLDEPGRRVALEMLVEHLETGLAVVANPETLEIPHVTHRLDLGG